MLVGVWLIYAIILAINFPFAILGTIFHFGYYRESTGFNSVFPALLVYIISFSKYLSLPFFNHQLDIILQLSSSFPHYTVILLFCARIVYSYYLQLKNSQSTPQSAVVV